MFEALVWGVALLEEARRGSEHQLPSVTGGRWTVQRMAPSNQKHQIWREHTAISAGKPAGVLSAFCSRGLHQKHASWDHGRHRQETAEGICCANRVWRVCRTWRGRTPWEARPSGGKMFTAHRRRGVMVSVVNWNLLKWRHDRNHRNQRGNPRFSPSHGVTSDRRVLRGENAQMTQHVVAAVSYL